MPPARSVSTSAFFAAATIAACGGTLPVPHADDPVVSSPRRLAGLTAAPTSSQPLGGSSDGTTCEQARDQYVEEMNLQGPKTADLKAEDFAAVLNSGTYLTACSVPDTSKVRVCAAVQNGRAVGVTVAVDPPNPETEVCVAGQVRLLSFPVHPKLDVVNVKF